MSVGTFILNLSRKQQRVTLGGHLLLNLADGSIHRERLYPDKALLERMDVRDLLIVNAEQLSLSSRPLIVVNCLTEPTQLFKEFLQEVVPASFKWQTSMSPVGSLTDVLHLLTSPFEALLIPKLILDLILSANDESAERLEKVIAGSKLMVAPLSIQPPPPGRGFVFRFGEQLEEALPPQVIENEYQEELSLATGKENWLRLAVLQRDYGVVIFSSSAGTGAPHLIPRPQYRIEPPSSLERVAPQIKFFSRKTLSKQSPLPKLDADAYWVAKDAAWPSEMRSHAPRVVWTPGLTTWKELAKQGVWVTGSAEGLGDLEDPRLSLIYPGLKWIRLSHSQAETDSPYPLFPTYELIPVAQVPDLSGYTHFFWRSGSSFLEALRHFPSIRDKWHASGPGQTHQVIMKALGGAEKVGIFLSETDFRSAMKVSKIEEVRSQDLYV